MGENLAYKGKLVLFGLFWFGLVWYCLVFDVLVLKEVLLSIHAKFELNVIRNGSELNILKKPGLVWFGLVFYLSVC